MLFGVIIKSPTGGGPFFPFSFPFLSPSSSPSNTLDDEAIVGIKEDEDKCAMWGDYKKSNTDRASHYS